MSAATQVLGAFAAAAIAAQRRLEEQLSRQMLLGTRPGEGMIYAFRKIALDSKFAIEKQKKNVFFFLFHVSGSGSNLMHHFQCELKAVPARPVPPADGGAASANIELAIPAFMLTLDEDEGIRESLSDAMKSGRWRSHFATSQKKVTDQAQQIVRPPEKGRGPLAFAVESSPPTYLIIDLNIKGDPDGIYIYFSDSQSTEIYNMPNAGQDPIQYAPLHRFARAVRAAVFKSKPAKREIPSATGLLADLDDFAAKLSDGYREARKVLAMAEDSQSLIPGFLEIGPLSAEIRYAATFNSTDGTGSPNITNRTVQDPISSIEGTARIQVVSEGMNQRTEVAFAMPSFVLSGDNLDLFLNQARAPASVRKITGQFKNDTISASVYSDAIQSQKEVLALQSFKGDHPSRDFLVVWPGTGEAAGRDFVFTCHMDSNGKQLSNVKAILKLGQNLEGITLVATDDDPDKRNQYLPFHNMFHSVLIWLTTLRSA